jgi:hypothetical protein
MIANMDLSRYSLLTSKLCEVQTAGGDSMWRRVPESAADQMFTQASNKTVIQLLLGHKTQRGIEL